MNHGGMVGSTPALKMLWQTLSICLKEFWNDWGMLNDKKANDDKDISRDYCYRLKEEVESFVVV